MPFCWFCHKAAQIVKVFLSTFKCMIIIFIISVYSQRIFLAFYVVMHQFQMSRDMTKSNNVAVRPAKTQISLGIRPV